MTVEMKMTEAGKTIVFNNKRLGQIEVDAEVVLTFPVGILGFNRLKRFALLPHKPGTPFHWLVPLDDTNVAFVVVNPDLVFNDYAPQPSADQLSTLGDVEGKALGVLTVVSFHGGRPTVNLRAPLVLDLERRIGTQVVLLDRKFETRVKLRQGSIFGSSAQQSGEINK